jgi:hypothetical protein
MQNRFSPWIRGHRGAVFTKKTKGQKSRDTFPLKQQSVEYQYHIHRCENWFTRSSGFCYNSASNFPTVALRAMVGPTVGISCCDVCNMPTVDMPQPADFGGFFSVPAAICQQSLKPLRKVPIIAKWIRCQVVAKSAGSKDPVLTLMAALLYGL